MELVETWYFQVWVNFGGMAVYISFLSLTEGKANRTTSSFDDRSITLMTDSTFEVYQ